MNESYAGIKRYCDENKVTLVAVSKTKSPAEISGIYQQGQKIFGENRVQELMPKYENLPKDIEWHLVGHLQTNKVKNIASFVSLIHSVDSMKLLEEIDKQGEKANRIIDVLLQVFIAKEETKFGLSEEEAFSILTSPMLNDLRHVSIRGLMGMATLTNDEGRIRDEFRRLHRFFIQVNESLEVNHKLQILSMGMSSDYRIAIEEGSNMVRIGSKIFGDRE